MRKSVEEALPVVKQIGRQDFLENYWHYKAGEHVTFLAPTQNGKTTMIFDLLKHTHLGKDDHPPIVLVVKPRDPTVTEKLKQLDYRIVRSWPPVPSPWKPKPAGYGLWPKHSFDPDADDEAHKPIMRRAILGAYRKGNTILVADETYGLMQDLGLGNEITKVHSRGAGMGVGIWCATQKPTHIGTWAYSQAEHLFIGYDPDKRARDRFSEIGGVDPDLVKHVAANLGKFEWLYIRRTGRVMAIIKAN